MPHLTRRFALLAAAVLATTLAACTNPVAPESPSKVKTPAERPSNTVYNGSFG